MFKKVIALSLVFVLLSNSIFASIDLSLLSSEHQQIFLNQALSIQTEQNTLSYSSGYAKPTSWGALSSGWGTSNTSTDWVPYRGAGEISKVDFLYATGQYDMAKNLENAYKTAENFKLAGYILTGVGSVGLLATLLIGSNYYGDSSVPLYILLGLSAGSLAVGIPFMFWQVDDNLSVSFAVGLADVYNQNLFDSLK
ncbi:MAG TPA: hypothetical protein IAA76_08405 [Candidatus Ornithospirochaeta stercorigallinarum]|nr:hypothetical protein [Candidatus Ornithospirochaeta stercorigallinarum]